MIARSLLLFVRSFVFFVDNDESEPFDGSEDRAPSADGHARFAAVKLVPFVMAFASGEVAMKNRDQFSLKPHFEALNRLRSERNFRDQHQSSQSLLQAVVNCL